jgi:hypothetical protein
LRSAFAVFPNSTGNAGEPAKADCEGAFASAETLVSRKKYAGLIARSQADARARS